MKWAPVPWKSSDFAPRGISFPEKLCYTTDITVKFLPFCQLGFVSAIPAPPQTSLRRKPSPKALPHKALGGQDHYLHFPVRGRKLGFCVVQRLQFVNNHYLHFPVRGRKLDAGPHVNRATVDHHYLHFPVRGRKLYNNTHNMHIRWNHYLHFPVRGRKPFAASSSASNFAIIIYISP